MRAAVFVEPFAIEYREVQNWPGFVIAPFVSDGTGSAFGLAAYFDEAAVEIACGALKGYEYCSDETNCWLRTEFCPTCGTTITATAEYLPGVSAIFAGTFDDPDWIKPRGDGWTRSALHWMVFPADVELGETTRLK